MLGFHKNELRLRVGIKSMEKPLLFMLILGKMPKSSYARTASSNQITSGPSESEENSSPRAIKPGENHFPTIMIGD